MVKSRPGSKPLPIVKRNPAIVKRNPAIVKKDPAIVNKSPAIVKQSPAPMRVMRVHEITSAENPSFREWKQLTQPRGIRKQGRALLSGTKIVEEAWQTFPERVLVLILGGTRM